MPPVVYVPSTPAPTHAGRFRLPGPPLGVSNAGGPFLRDVFPGGRQLLEAAFGADIVGDPGGSSWVWTDITPYALWENGAKAKIGYPDEASKLVPASFTVDLKNYQTGGGDFTIGNALGAFWPNVVENTPIRRSLDVGGGYALRFQGYATSWKPARSPGGLSLVKLTAHGISRRVEHGASAKQSAMRRSYDYGSVRPTAYWSLEGGSGSSVSYDIINNLPTEQVDQSAAVAGQSGAVRFGEVELGDGSDRVPNIAGSWSLGMKLARTFPTTGTYSFQFHQQHGTDVRSGGLTVTALRQDPLSAARHLNWQFYVYDDKTCQLDLIEANPDFSVAAGPTTLFTGVSVGNLYDGVPRAFQLDIQASGGTNVAWQVWMDGASLASGTTTPSFSGAMNAGVYRVASLTSSIDASGTVGVGHYAVFSSIVTANKATPLGGNRGEFPHTRIARVAAEQGIRVDITGTSDIAMGPQGIASFTDILQDAGDADMGVLFDGLGPGYTYVCRTSAYSRNPGLLLSSSNSDLVGDVEGDHDDRGRVNDFTLTNNDGLQRRFVQPDGDLGTRKVGTYDDSGQANINAVSDLYQGAAFKVGQGTVPGVRWPVLSVHFEKPATSAKAVAWLNCLPFDRVDALGISTGSNPNRALLLRGWTETTNSKLFVVDMNVTPYDVFDVDTLAGDTGDNSPFIGWLDSDSTYAITTAADLTAGGTSVVCNVLGTAMTNPGVASYADDLIGLYAMIDGLRIGITAISAPVGGQQTLTVTGTDVLRKIRAGASVTAADPPTVGF